MAEKKYIDAEAFNSAIREAVRRYPNTFYNGLETARKIAYDFPAADVRPVVRGVWNAVKGALHPAETSAVCSNCGFATMIHAQTFYNFCPNCGADMRPTSMSGANEEES